MIFVASFMLSVLLVFVGMQFLSYSAHGMPNVAIPEELNSFYLISLLCGAMIFAGILSSVLFDRFDKRYKPKSSLFRKTDLIIASALSPIVFLSFYPLMQETQDQILKILLAYQNGFFFQNVVSRISGISDK